MFKLIFFGDIMGKIGRKAIIQIAPKWKKKYAPDLVVANAENLAHGKGVTKKTLQEMLDAGIDFFTSGNHVWDKKDIYEIFEDPKAPIIRPANYPPGVPGDGYRIIDVGRKKVLILNLIGRIFFREQFDCPFRIVDHILETLPKDVNIKIVDFHVEATSEAKCLGYYLQQKVSAVLGTHTHVGTCDDEILEKATAYITQVGMVGAKHSSLGINFEPVIKTLMTQLPAEHQLPEKGLAEINAIYLEIDNNGKAKKIKKLYEEIEIK